MSDNAKLFDAASLAEASYADFYEDGVFVNTTEKAKAALIAKSWSSTQADDFLSRWRIAAQQPNTASGFSATLFERLDSNGQGTGEYVFANRGTETDTQFGLNLVPQDLEADLGDLVLDGLAWEQIVDMYNYWQQLITEPNTSYQKAVLVPASASPFIVDIQAGGNVTAWQITFVSASDGLGLLSPDALVQVTGHSLGGHLASAFARLFPGSVSQAYSINGAGYAEILGNGNIQYVFSALHGASTFDSAVMQNFYGNTWGQTPVKEQ